MATVSTPEVLLTAEQFGERPDPGYPEELVRGRIVRMPPPKPRHGEICIQVAYLLRRYLEEHDLGRVLGNDSGIITERDPDTLRGADIAFYSYDRVPKGPLPDDYLTVVPELVIEVRSPSDRWPKVFQKVGEYLAAGVSVVVVLDDHRRFRPHVLREPTARPADAFGPEEELSPPRDSWVIFASLSAPLLRVSSTAEPWPCRLTTQEQVDLLKMPTCFGAARRVVLDHLGHIHHRRFLNHWAFVRFADENHLNLALKSLPRRPRAMNELGHSSGR